jgi:hypothetical protein
MRRRSSSFAFALAFVATGLSAAEYKLLNACDTNKDRKIDDTELLGCLLLKDEDAYKNLGPTDNTAKFLGGSCDAVSKVVDEGESGKSPEELVKYHVANALDNDCSDLKDNLGLPPFEHSDLAGAWGLKPLGGPSFQVRRSVEEIDLSQEPESFKKATGAILGYSENFLEKSTTLTAEGSLMQIQRFDKGNWDRARVPSISLKKIQIKKAGSESDEGEVDELTGRYTLHFINGGNSAAGRYWGHEFKIGLAYLTDTDFEQRIGAIEADWFPFRASSCFSSFRFLGKSKDVATSNDGDKSWKIRCLIGLRAEAGNVFESADPAQQDDENFLRVGPTAGFQLVKGPVTLSLRYTWRREIEGDAEDSDLLKAGLDLALDAASHWSLSAAYEDGELPLSLKPTRTLIVGLGIKY